MHLLVIGATQPVFGKHLGLHRTRTPFRDKASSRSFFCGNEKGVFSAWKLFGIGKNLNFDFRGGHESRSGGTLLIKAVATLEPKSLVGRNGNKHFGLSNSQLVIDKSSSLAQTRYLDGHSEDLDEKERLRRTRISKANKGNMPWNKGKKHSPETLQRIRERTRLAMQHPKVKMKLTNGGHAQTEETRVKIGYGVRKGWERRRKKLLLQETCYFEWQNLIAEASRKGYDGESELQWDSYEILNEKLKEVWLESIEIRKSTPRPKGSKRAPKSPEQRRKISEAISRKWADTAYRERVVSALAKYHGIEPGAERKTRKRPRDGSEAPRRSPIKKTASNANHSEMKIRTPKPKLRKHRAPSYKDPLASSKLEMIKNIRAQRASVEIKKIEAVERAKLLIAEAENAAKALEAAATKSPIARASLIETRKLIAEAIRSIKSIEMEQISSWDSNEDSSAVQDEPGNQEDPRVVPEKLVNQIDMETDAAKEILTGTSTIKVNGTRTLAPSPTSIEENLSFSNGKLSLQDIASGDEGLFSVNSTGFDVSPKSYNSLVMRSGSGSTNENGKWETKRDGEKQEKPLVNGAGNVETLTEQVPVKAATVTKKWVRGRLVEVAEGEALN